MCLEGQERLLVVSREDALVQKMNCDPSLRIHRARSGHEGLQFAARNDYDVVLTCVPLPDMHSVDFVTRLREWSNASIVAIVPEPKTEAKVALLNAGADDCMSEPFGFAEFRARIRLAFRHRQQMGRDLGPTVKMGATTFNLANQEVTVNGQLVNLSNAEFRILAELVKNTGDVVTHEQLTSKLWAMGFSSDIGIVRAYIAAIRKKLSIHTVGDVVIETIHGIGYRLSQSHSDAKP